MNSFFHLDCFYWKYLLTFAKVSLYFLCLFSISYEICSYFHWYVATSLLLYLFLSVLFSGFVCVPDLLPLDKSYLYSQIQSFINALPEYPLHSHGLINAPKVLADVVESNLGAVFIDSNSSIDTTWEVCSLFPLKFLVLKAVQNISVTWTIFFSFPASNVYYFWFCMTCR